MTHLRLEKEVLESPFLVNAGRCTYAHPAGPHDNCVLLEPIDIDANQLMGYSERPEGVVSTADSVTSSARAPRSV